MPSIEITRAKYRTAPVILTVLAVVALLSALAHVPNVSAGVTARMASRFKFSVQRTLFIR